MLYHRNGMNSSFVARPAEPGKRMLKDSGISRIHFFNLGMDKARIGERRQHPLSDLIVEQIVAVPRPGGRFDFVHSLERPLQTIAVWLSADGDDSRSQFTVLVERSSCSRRLSDRSRPCKVIARSWVS